MKTLIKSVLAAFLIFAVFCAIFAVWLDREIDKETSGERPFSFTDANAVVGQITAGKLAPNHYGVVAIDKMSPLHVGMGTVTVTKASGGGSLIYFPTRSERFGARGYLYSYGIVRPQLKVGNSVYTHSERLSGLLSKLDLVKKIGNGWWRVNDGDVANV